jgi:hypothetical protein
MPYCGRCRNVGRAGKRGDLQKAASSILDSGVLVRQAQPTPNRASMRFARSWRSFMKTGERSTARRRWCEHRRVDAASAQHRLQVGATERAGVAPDHDRFPSRSAAAGWVEAPSVQDTGILFAFTQLNRELQRLTSG